MVDQALARQEKLTLTTGVTLRNLPFFRATFRALNATTGRRLAPGVTFDDLTVGGVEVRPYRPPTTNGGELSPALIWVHGGGLILGSHKEDTVCSGYVDALNIPVVSINYRLAPEHPFPAAIDDLFDVVAEIRSGAVPGIDPERLVVGGQSAGGGLTAALVQRLYDEGVGVQGQLLIYPMLDDRTAVRSDIDDKDHKAWNKSSNVTGWSAYLGTDPGQDEVAQYAVPGRREDLSGLPPAWVGIGTKDMFMDESLSYAERLTAAGVPCTTLVVEGAIHGFDVLPVGAKSDAADNFRAAQYEFLRDLLHLA